MTARSKILTRRRFLKQIKRKKTKTWFNLGIFLDKLQQRKFFPRSFKACLVMGDFNS